MQSLGTYIAPPSSCSYLPDQEWSLEYETVAWMTAAEYFERMRQGWRRFGHTLFRPRCRACTACRSLRIVVNRFRADRSQRRALRTNEGEVHIHIGEPCVSRTKLALYDKYHAFQSDHKGWPLHPAKDADDYALSFVLNPFPTEEWCYFVDDRLVGVGYVDSLPGGLSAIYFFYDPEERHRSLGTYNVLKVIEAAAQRGLPHVYLGYYVAGSPSMLYKSRFLPNQLLGIDGRWHDFLA